MEKYVFDHSKFIVDPNKKIELKNLDTEYTTVLKDKKDAEKSLMEDVSNLVKSQDLLWANSKHSVLIIFQAMDAAGKDGTIKHVMSGINPQGCEVVSFKAPTDEENKHNFLWRPMKYLPSAGRITIFNRSYYEEVLIVKVHQEFLKNQTIPQDMDIKDLWEHRYKEINRFEKWLTDNNTCVIKFFLNVSKKEQKKRFLDRLSDETKYWKFNESDVKERLYWFEYQKAFEDMLNNTSTQHSPWYVIPADKKWFMRALVADIISDRILKLDMKYPEISKEQKEKYKNLKVKLENGEFD